MILKSAEQEFNDLPPDRKAIACRHCYGTGVMGENGETPYRCPECGGHGVRIDALTAENAKPPAVSALRRNYEENRNNEQVPWNRN